MANLDEKERHYKMGFEAGIKQGKRKRNIEIIELIKKLLEDFDKRI